MSSPRMKELALRKEILALKAETYRMEIDQQVERLGGGLRGIFSGLSVARLIRSHPLVVSAMSALVSRVGPLRLLKLAAAGALAWFAYQVAEANRGRGGP